LRSVAFATYAALPRLSLDDQLAAQELESRGVRVTAAVWSDPDVRWAEFDAVVLRSTWDYHRRPVEFCRWLDELERVGAKLWNPIPIARWNMDKRYLRDLAARGVAVAPTVWLPRGTAVDLAALLDERGWSDVVIKPVVSATAFETIRADRGSLDAAHAHAQRLLATSDVMVQQFLPEIASGEWSLVFLSGAFSHAVRKRPRPGDFRVQPEFGGSEAAAAPPAAVLRAGRAVLRAVDDRFDVPWLYARVDGVQTDREFLVLELEMLEPWLFFRHEPGAASRFADGLIR
jgi:glutathione synthase/RimK-type ligase-like ATP-grasp enzyme